MSDQLLHESKPIRQAYFQTHDQLLSLLAHHGQKPRAFFITCADSRIMPESLFGLNAGDFFVMRNVGNIIPPYIQTEIGIISALEFAVLELKIPHIVVMGHTDCGAMLGLDQHIDMATRPALSRWLDVARPAQRDIDFHLRNLSPEERHIAIVEQNVRNQLQNISSYPFVRAAWAQNKLQLHGWVYYLAQKAIGYWDAQLAQFSIKQ